MERKEGDEEEETRRTNVLERGHHEGQVHTPLEKKTKRCYVYNYNQVQIKRKHQRKVSRSVFSFKVKTTTPVYLNI